MIIAAIPARAGSKGIPDKNIVDLGGKPLLAWSIEVAKEVPEINQVFVSTDSIEYSAISVECGVFAIDRPADISQDDSPDYEWIKHFIDTHRIKGWGYANCDLIIHLRPTTPLRDPQVISKAIKQFQDTPGATSLRSVHEMGESAWKCFQIHEGYLSSLSNWLYDWGEWFVKAGVPKPSNYRELIGGNAPRQMYTKTYHPNGYVDILRVSHIFEHGELYGDKILAFETPRVTEIDTPEDLEYVRWQVKQTPPNLKDIHTDVMDGN